MTEAARDWLLRMRNSGSKLGLENPRWLAGRFGNPQERLDLIHVAGTNGKGSVCAFLECVYRMAGYRTGLYTSPHLVDFAERIQVDRRLLPDAALVSLADRTRRLLSPSGPRPTYFEVVTIMALEHFAESGCELVLLETGLGGRLDATNIVTPRLSIITSVGLDHQQQLGSGLERIAREKAGIIKRGVPCLHAATHPLADAVIRDEARAMDAPCTGITFREALETTRNIPLGLDGAHQRLNAALAIRAVEILQESFPVPAPALERGLAEVRWPGRLQLLPYGSGRILLDGAHNEAGMVALCRWLGERYRGTPRTVILGILEDKGCGDWLLPLLRQGDRFMLVPVRNGRTLDPEVVARWIADEVPDRPVACPGSLQGALEIARNTTPLLVVCGSLHLVGEALSLLSPGRDHHPDLNEPATRRAPEPSRAGDPGRRISARTAAGGSRR